VAGNARAAEAAADAAAARLLPLCCALACGWLEGAQASRAVQPDPGHYPPGTRARR